MTKRKVNKKACSKCKELFHPGILWRHEKYCKNRKKQYERKIKDEWKQENGNYKCPFCEKEFSVYGIFLHIYKNHTKEGKKHDPNIGYKLGTRTVWNKGLTKETDERVRKQSETFKEAIKKGTIF